MKTQRQLFALTVALFFFAILPCIHLRPFHRFSVPTLIAFQFPLEHWYDIPHPIKLQLSGDDGVPSDDPYGGGPRPAWLSFAVVCLIAYLTVMANGGGLTHHILHFLPLVSGIGMVAFVSAAIGVPIDLWSQNRFRLSIRGLLVLAAIIAYILALLASGP